MNDTAALDTGPLKRQTLIFTVLRIVIGWHFLYEGVVKMLMGNWSSAAYLENSRWLLCDFFHWIAANPTALRVVDLLNMWGLSLIGLCLILGCVTRLSAWVGVLLTALYYVAHPPFLGGELGAPAEGHYLIVNKVLIEGVALAAIALFPIQHSLGLDRLWMLIRKTKTARPADASAGEGRTALALLGRREILKNLATVPVLGAFSYAVSKKYKWERIHAITGATLRVGGLDLKDLKGALSYGNIGDKQISRVILGGNLIGGWAHSRDLIYVSSLFKAYNTEKKIFETLMLAEQAGINTINISHTQFPLINKYKKVTGSRLQTVSQIHPTRDDVRGHVDKVIDQGVDFIQIQGNCCDWRVRDAETDVLAECMDYIKQQGYPAGLGAHSIQALMACDKMGIKADFYMKTLHHDRYWSAHPKENRVPFSVDGKRSDDHNQFHDNMFCLFADETIDFMKKKQTPFMAFKVLAGGAIHPQDGFRFAFENGADFVCVGMFDFQIVEDVNIALDTLSGLGCQERGRPWCA